MQIAPKRSITALSAVVETLRLKLAGVAPDRPSDGQTFRPRLADNVRLVGPMHESAFAVQPWLLERNGRFMQVTELLYRIAELADGSRSVDQIAADAAEATGSEVSSGFVWRMLQTRLVPAGIITADPPFQVASGSSTQAAATTGSPLALNMRMAVVSPRLIDPLTRWLRYLYAPPVLLLLLFVTLQAQYWLLFVHGVAGGISEALNSPGVVPIVFGLVVASAAFHELGHAAALRYGGGHVRGMGVGFYMMYPAFYTDVTDNYRLGRWARVRTDLGGFYFNLLFSLGLMGIYHATGYEFLLVVALLTDIEIVHQCLPFVRLDGYWALADLTGIPDFFSFMGAYLRSMLPVPGWKGRKLPRLKWWATAAFAVYIAITIPVLAVLLFATVKNTPRILVTAYAAVQQKLAEVAQAQATGDLVAAAGAEAQIALLLLPVFGLALVLFTIARGFGLALWRWGRPTRGRRFASALAAAAVAAVLLLVWLPGFGNPTTYARLSEIFRTPPGASAAAPITPEDAGTVPQAVAAMPAPPVIAGLLPTPTAARARQATPIEQPRQQDATPEPQVMPSEPQVATSEHPVGTAAPVANTVARVASADRASAAASPTPSGAMPPDSPSTAAPSPPESRSSTGVTGTAEAPPTAQPTAVGRMTPEPLDTPAAVPTRATAPRASATTPPPASAPTRPVQTAMPASQAPAASTRASSTSGPAATASRAPSAQVTSTSVPATAPSPTTVPARTSTPSSLTSPSASPAASAVPSPATR